MGGGRPAHLLMFAERDIAVAEEWRDRAPPTALPPTGTQLDFIAQSRFRRRRTQRHLLTGAVSAVVVTSVFALVQWGLASKRERDNKASVLAAEAKSLLGETWPYNGWAETSRSVAALVSQAITMDENLRYVEPAVELASLLRPVTRKHLPYVVRTSTRAGTGTLIVATADGRLLSIATADGTATTIHNAVGAPFQLSASENGATIAVHSFDEGGSAILRRRDDGTWHRAVLSVGGIKRLILTADGSRYVIRLDDGRLAFGAAAHAEAPPQIVPAAGKVDDVFRNIDGSILAVDADGATQTVRLDAATPTPAAGLASPVRGLGYFPFPEHGLAIFSSVGGVWLRSRDRVERLDLAIVAAAMSRDSDLIAVAAWDGAIHLWSRAGRREVARLPFLSLRSVAALFFDSAGDLNALNENDRWRWRTAMRMPRLRFECHLAEFPMGTAENLLWTVCQGGVPHVVRLINETTLDKIPLPAAPTAVADTARGLVVAGDDQALLVADHRRIDPGWPLAKALAGARLLASNGQYIAAYHAEGDGIRIFDAVGAKEVAAAATDLFAGGALGRLALSDGILFACSETNLCAAWRLVAGVPSGAPLTAQFEPPVQDIHLDASCGCAVVAGFTGLWRWDLRTGERRQLSAGGPIFASGLLPGQRAYTSISNVEIVDLLNGKPRDTLRHRGEVQGGVAALGKSGLMVTFGMEGIGRLWDINTLVEVARFPSPGGYPHAIKPIGDARRFALVSSQFVEIWDLTSSWLYEGVCAGVVGEMPPAFWQRRGIMVAAASRC